MKRAQKSIARDNHSLTIAEDDRGMKEMIVGVDRNIRGTSMKLGRQETIG